MIVVPKTQKEWDVMVQFINFYSGVQPSTELRMLGWVTDDKLAIVVGFDGFIGKMCSSHVAMLPNFHFTPRIMLQEMFRFAFHTLERELLLGIVNSNNEKAMKYDLHLGFKEFWRIPHMHTEDGDLVVLGMYKHECPYLEDVEQPAAAVN